MYLGSARTSGASDAIPSRVGTTSEESSPGAESSKKDTKKTTKNHVLKRPASSKTVTRKMKKQGDDDDDDESPDDDHQPLAKGLHRLDDDEDSADLEGLEDLLRLESDEEKPKKRPASKTRAASGSKKRPAKKVGTPKIYPYT